VGSLSDTTWRCDDTCVSPVQPTRALQPYDSFNAEALPYAWPRSGIVDHVGRKVIGIQLGNRVKGMTNDAKRPIGQSESTG